MKKEVRREKVLPAFSIRIGDLEALWERLSVLFGDPEKIYAKIEIVFPSETLEFDSVADLKKYPELRGKYTKFRIWLSQGGRHISIKSNALLSSHPEVSVSAESEAWCAGAIETVYSFIQSNKLWYHWFFSMPIGWLLFLFINIPTIAMFYLPKEQQVGKFMVAAWVAITITIAGLYIARAKLLPSSILFVSEEEGFFKRNAAEISLVIAIVSAVLTVIGWFFGK